MRIVAIALLVVTISTTVRADWPQWRGPARDGVVPAASVPAAWPDKLSPGWRQAIGEGYSSPVVEDGRVFVLSRSEPDEVVSACDATATIPVRAESLNAAMAATVALYECNRRMAAR